MADPDALAKLFRDIRGFDEDSGEFLLNDAEVAAAIEAYGNARYREGAEAMRERAATAALEWSRHQQVPGSAQDSIRKLPLGDADV